jgi:DNA-binding LytR/AlgR family response regulator
MNILIVENEKPAADKIVRLLKRIDKSITVTGMIESVEGTVEFLQKEKRPDLILMDIQLDDGLCFEIFEIMHLNIPVIFTSAYDEYTLKAFKVNSVDYLLKPIEEIPLSNAIHKFKSLHHDYAIDDQLLRCLYKDLNTFYKNRFLIKIGANYRSVPVGDIGCFYVLERAVFIRTFDDREYSIDFSLDYIQNVVDPKYFYRISRNCIININAIRDIVSFSSSRLLIKINSRKTIADLIVSREKVSEFKQWAGK